MSFEIITKYFPNLNSTQKEQFGKLLELYTFWNDQINVISRKDIDQLYERHVLHSLGIAKVTTFSPGSKILDVGTGGGFPGIPLAIMFPEVDFFLVDSIGKKIKVVTEVAQGLGLKNVRAAHERAEKINEQFDFIVSRAVTEFPAFYNWIKNKVSKKQNNAFENGVLYLKGGDLTEELKSFRKRILLFELKNFFDEEFFETKKVVYMPI